MTKTHSMFSVLVVIAVLLAANLVVISSEPKAVAEVPPQVQQTAETIWCPSDINGDNEVDIVDFLLLLANWGPCRPACGNPTGGDCCVPHGTPYCDDLNCCSLICAIDPFCCDFEWDLDCAVLASGFCGLPGCS